VSDCKSSTEIDEASIVAMLDTLAFWDLTHVAVYEGEGMDASPFGMHSCPMDNVTLRSARQMVWSGVAPLELVR